jgi:hypothetical protein
MMAIEAKLTHALQVLTGRRLSKTNIAEAQRGINPAIPPSEEGHHNFITDVLFTEDGNLIRERVYYGYYPGVGFNDIASYKWVYNTAGLLIEKEIVVKYDAPHGSIIKHDILEYNPPGTLKGKVT